MKKEKKNNKFLVAVVALVLLAIGVGYAALSRQYTLTGTANVTGTSWDIGTGLDDGEDVTPTCKDIDGTNMTCANPDPIGITETPEGDIDITYTATLAKPGQTYSFIVPVTNTGKSSAKIAELKGEEIVEAVTEGGKTAEEAAEIAKFLTVSVVDASNDTAIAEGDELAAPEAPATETVKNIKVTVKYRDDNQNQLPTSDNNGITLKTTIKFGQA